jgi:pimeloyl-ACP methyl ester carboxylesterase
MSNQHLVMIPGLNCTARLYAAQIGPLSRSHSVLVPDHSGQASMGAIAERILALAPPRFALAGLSMGGYIAFEIMRKAPERVTRLVLLDTQARPDAPERAEFRRGQVRAAREGRFHEVIEGSWPNLVHPARHEDAALKAVHVAMCEETGVEGFAREIEAIIGRADSRPTLGQIKVPTLVIVGAEDALTPVELNKEIADGIPGACLEVIPHCGHLSTIEKPETVTRLMEGWMRG